VATAILTVKIDSEGNLSVLKEAKEEIAGTGAASKTGADRLKNFKEAAALAGGALAAIKGMQAAAEFVKLGTQIQATEQRFTAFAGGTRQAQEYLETFQEATDGTVDRLGAMAGASKMLQMGLVDNAEEMGVMAAVATKLGDQTMGAGQRLADFSALLANRSIPRLDNFGISSGKVRARVEELKQAGYDLDEAFKLAVLEEGSKSLAVLGDTSELAATKVARMEAKWADTKNTMATAFATIVDGLGVLDKLASYSEDTAQAAEAVDKYGFSMQAWAKGVGTYLTTLDRSQAIDAFNEKLITTGDLQQRAALSAQTWQKDEDALRGELELTQAALADLTAHEEMLANGTAHTDEARLHAMEISAQYQEALENERIATENAMLAQIDLAARLADASQAQIAQAAITELKGALDAGTITFDQYTAAVTETQLEFGLATPASIALSEGVLGLTGSLADGTLKASDYSEALEAMIGKSDRAVMTANRLRDALNGIPRNIKVSIDVQERISARERVLPTPGQQRQHGGPAMGMTWIGEDRPELLELPRGSYVHSPDQSRRMMRDVPAPSGGGGGGRTLIISPTVHIATGAVRSDDDIERIMQGMEEILTVRGARVFEV